MADTEKSLKRDKERKRFDAYSIEDVPGEEVDVEVKPALSAMLSLRLDQEHFKKLKTLARIRKTGVTTLARTILQEALDDYGVSARAAAPKSSRASEGTSRVIAESRTAYGDDGSGFLVIPVARLERLNQLVGEAVRKMWMEALLSEAATVTPGQDGLHESLRKLDTMGR
jgi:hypothetical protein